MRIERVTDGGKCTLALHGRLDTATAPMLQDAMAAVFGEAQQVELDFANTEYISSAGLRVLLVGQKTAQAKGAAMTLTGVSEEIMEVLEMTGFTNILTIV